MSKKQTLKSVAVSAVIALGMTGFVGVSASAAPSGTVTLAPTTGIEYTVAAGNAVDFSLTSSNTADAIGSTGLLKWKIDYPTADDQNVVPINVGATATTVGGSTVLASAVAAWYQTDNLVHLFLTDASSKVAVGSEIVVQRQLGTRADDNDNSEDTDVISYANYGPTDEVARVTDVGSNYVRFVTSGAQATVSSIVPGSQGDNSSASWGGAYTISFGNTAGSITAGVQIVDSRHNAPSFNKTLVLRKNDNNTTTRTVKVTAWVDIDDDGVIDADETASPERTVTFINPTAVALATDGFEFTGPTAAQKTMTAKITTVPVLNQAQSTLVPRTLFTSQFFQANVLGSVNSFWGSSVRATASPTAGFEAVTSTSADQTVQNGSPSADLDGVISRNPVATGFLPGFYTARPFLTAAGAADNADTTFGTTVPLAVTAVTASIAADRIAGLYATIAGSNNVSPDTSTAAADGVSSSVRLGTASADVSVLAVSETVLKTPIGAGKTVVATISDSTNYKLNGGNGPVVLTTSASGTVSVSVSKVAPAVAGGPVSVTFTATDIDGTLRTVVAQLTWAPAAYKLYNLNDTNATEIEDFFSVKASESISFSIGLHDQWKVPAPTATYRIKAAVAGNGVSVTSNGVLPWTGNVANLSVASNGTTGTGVITVDFSAEKLTGATWASEAGVGSGVLNRDTTAVEGVAISVVPSTLTYAASDLTTAAALVDDIQNVDKVVSWDPRSSQLARDGYVETNRIDVSTQVRDASTGLPRPYAKVTISGASDFMFATATTVDRLGSTSAISDANGQVTFRVYSNRSVKDAVLTIATDGGTSTTTKVTFLNPSSANATSISFASTPKSIKAGRTLLTSASVVDKWGNVVLRDGTAGKEAFSLTTNRGLLIESTPIAGSASIYQVKVLLQQLDRGPVVLQMGWARTADSSPVVAAKSFSATRAVWAGPAVNAVAGAAKGRVVVEAYSAKGKTVNVFVGRTKVASFVADAKNDRFVVRGIKSGTRNISVRIVGPGYDFSESLTVK